MGLFGVNMPLLYGEGRRAFLRLQLEIMKISDDESLFAWTDSPSHVSLGPLAVSPVAFRHAGNVVRIGKTGPAAAPYSMTNKGISISLALISRTEASEIGVQVKNYPKPDAHASTIFAPLNCGISRSPGSPQLQILLCLRTNSTGSARWHRRAQVSQLAMVPLVAFPIRPQTEQIFLFFSQSDHSIDPPRKPDSHFTIQAKKAFHMGYTALAVSKVRDSAIYEHRHIEVDPEGVFIYDAMFGRGGMLGQVSRNFIEFKGPRGLDGLSEAFVLQIDYTSDQWAMKGITLILPGELDRLISDAKNRPSSPCDRASIVLPSGCRVYAAFRKRIRAGKLAYRIDIDVSVPEGAPKGEKDAPNDSHAVFQDRAQQQTLVRRMGRTL
jgi:hypothetical protein